MQNIIVAQEPLGDFLVLALYKNEWIVIASTPSRPLADQIANTTRSPK
jgi:hypothetical protein